MRKYVPYASKSSPLALLSREPVLRSVVRNPIPELDEAIPFGSEIPSSNRNFEADFFGLVELSGICAEFQVAWVDDYVRFRFHFRFHRVRFSESRFCWSRRYRQAPEMVKQCFRG